MFGQTGKIASTINSGALVTGNNITLGNSYELLTQKGVQYLSLKKYKNFGLFARTIASADSEYNWTWGNRSEVASANENTTTANAARLTAATTTSDWYGGPYTAARRYKTFSFGASSILKPKVLIARISNNASTNYTGTGIQITDTSDNTNFLRYQIGFAAAAQKIISYISTSPQETACTAGNLTNGIWLRITLFNNTALLDYNLTVQTTPPTTGWVRDRSVTFNLDITKTYAIGIIQIVNAVTSGLLSDILYYDDSGLIEEAGDTVNPTWAAQGYDTANTAIQLLADYDLGSAAPTLKQATIRNILADIQNKLYGDSATWTFSVKQSQTVGASAGSYAAAASVTVEGSGRYANVWAKANSDGTQPGSLILPFTLPIVAT